jgi:hypothetical protein
VGYCWNLSTVRKIDKLVLTLNYDVGVFCRGGKDSSRICSA